MPNETPEPTFHLIPTLIVVGSAIAFGIALGLLKLAFF